MQCLWGKQTLAEIGEVTLQQTEASPYPVECLLGDPGYMELDHFFFRLIDTRKLPDLKTNPVLSSFNFMHAWFRVALEWGIGRMKMKLKKFLETYPNTCKTFDLMCTSSCILTNYIHCQKTELLNIVWNFRCSTKEMGPGNLTWSGSLLQKWSRSS